MSKIAIISQPDQGVLIDVSGCTTLQEALDHLGSTLQVSNQFWHGMNVSINLGALATKKDELGKILTLTKSVGIKPSGVYSTNDDTRDALKAHNIPLATGKPMTLPAVSMDPSKITSAEHEDDRHKAGPLATITMRVVDAVSRRGAKEPVNPPPNELEEMQTEYIEDKRPAASAGDDSHFPHVKPKRKVSLDGRKIQSTDATPKAPKKPVAQEPVDASQEETLKFEPEDTIDPDQTLKLEPEAKAYAPTVEMKTPIDAEVITGAKHVSSEINTKEEQEITGPQVEVKVMSIQASEGIMLEAQPAQKAIAHAATITAEIVTQVDADCNIDAEDVDEDIEQAEEFDEEETDAMDVGLAARNGPATLYIRQNLRSGQTVSHKGHLVIIGDINPGAEVMADGDITVWGSLRGVAHAGIGGNVNAEIRALKLQPIQIRIAHAIARAPDRPRLNYATTNGPETARMVEGKIRVFRSRLD